MRHLLILSILVAAGQTVLAGEPRPDLAADIGSFVQPYIDRGLITGVSIGILKDGEAGFLNYGVTDSAGGGATTPSTLYEIGSITKTFTATLLADAIRRGEVAMDDSVEKFLPETVHVPTYTPSAGFWSSLVSPRAEREGVGPPQPDRGSRVGGPSRALPITLLHLTTHTSGLPRMPTNFAPADPTNPYADYTADLLYGFLNSYKLPRRPGEAFEYSNLAAGLLGHALARRVDRPYDRLLSERILTPLGMGETSSSPPPPEERTRLSPGHDPDLQAVPGWDLNSLVAAGGIRSSSRDMLRYLAAQLDPPATALGLAIADTHEKKFPVEEPVWIAMGWFTNGGDYWHNGATGGYNSFAWFHPRTKTAIVLLSNTSSRFTDSLGWRVAMRVIGNPRYKDPIPLPPRAVELSPEKLLALVGKYSLSPIFILDVSRENDKLYVQVSAQPRVRVYPESETAFYYKVVDARITFEPGEDGRAKSLVLHQDGRDMPALRVPETR